MKSFKLILLSALFPMGCASFQSISLDSGPSYPRGWAVFDYVVFSFNLNVETIDTVRSYAIAPGDKRHPGQQYRIAVEPNIGTNAIYRPQLLEAKVFMVEANGKRLRKLENGVWSFHFVVERNGLTQTIDQRWRIGSTSPSLILGGR